MDDRVTFLAAFFITVYVVTSLVWLIHNHMRLEQLEHKLAGLQARDREQDRLIAVLMQAGHRHLPAGTRIHARGGHEIETDKTRAVDVSTAKVQVVEKPIDTSKRQVLPAINLPAHRKDIADILTNKLPSWPKNLKIK